MPINYYIFLSIALFVIGIIGVLTRRNAIIIFMCIELMLNAVNLLLVLVAALRNTEQQMTELGTGDIGLIQNLGKVLFTEFVVPFEIASILFLSAMVGAVVIGKRDEAATVVRESDIRKVEEPRKAMNI